MADDTHPKSTYGIGVDPTNRSPALAGRAFGSSTHPMQHPPSFNAKPSQPVDQDSDSLAPTPVSPEESRTTPKEKRKSWIKRHLPGLSSPSDNQKEKREPISASGPYIFAFDPNTGTEVLQRNPHWPDEDTWKREKETEGQWAMGSEMAGPKGQHEFGGTVG